jgi:hypothetical protein
MVTVLPCLAIMRAVTDKNIDSAASKIRVKAFDCAIDLQSISGAKLGAPTLCK